jgi:hypothetical protein
LEALIRNNTINEYLGWLEWIIRRKMNGNKKNTPSIRAIRGTHYSCLPMKHIFCYRTYQGGGGGG